MLVGVYGDVGSGKGIFVVDVMHKHPELQKLVNFTLKLPRVRKVTPDEVLNIEMDEFGNEFCLTEGYTWIDNRLSPSKGNRLSSYGFFQSRKSGAEYIIDTQIRGTLDLRFRLLETYSIYAHERRRLNRFGSINKEDFNYTYIKGRRSHFFKLAWKKAKKLFGLYNSFEKIVPHDIDELRAELITTNPEKLNKKIDAIIHDFDVRGFDLSTITHNVVKDYLLRLPEPFVYEPFVYVRLKAQQKK